MFDWYTWDPCLFLKGKGRVGGGIMKRLKGKQRGQLNSGCNIWMKNKSLWENSSDINTVTMGVKLIEKQNNIMQTKFINMADLLFLIILLWVEYIKCNERTKNTKTKSYLRGLLHYNLWNRITWY